MNVPRINVILFSATVGAEIQMYIHVCTVVHTLVFWASSGHTHPWMYKSTLYTFFDFKEFMNAHN